MTQERIMFSNPTPSELRLSPAATMSDVKPSALTPSLHCASSTESEFYIMSLCGLDCVYLRCMMNMMGYKQSGATAIAQDINACTYLVKGSGMHNRARYIDHRIRELATGASPEVRLCEIAGGDQPSDILIKGLLRLAFDKHMAVLIGELL